MSDSYDPNNWYDRNGVKRPEHIPFLTEEDLLKTFDKIRKETVHGDWVQQGNHITCRKCNPTHTSPIPVNYLLQGTDNKGLPVFKKIDL